MNIVDTHLEKREQLLKELLNEIEKKQEEWAKEENG